MKVKARAVILGAIVGVILVMLFLGTLVSAQDTETLVIHFKGTEVLTNNNINVTKVQDRVKEMYGKANVTVSFCTGNESAKGHVIVTFSNASNCNGTLGERKIPCTRNSSVVYVGEILKKFKNKMTGATAQQNASIIALIAAHETGEVYLEDLPGDPNRAYVMEGCQSIENWWKDAKNATCGWPATGDGSAALLRKRISDDKVCNKSATEYHPGEDHNGTMYKPHTVYSGENFVVTVYGEGWSIPYPNIYVSFGTDITMTDVNGKAYFTAPHVTVETLVKVTAYRDDVTLASQYMTVKPITPVGGFTIPIGTSDLSAPYIVLTTTIIASAIATAVWTNSVKRKDKK